VLRVALSPTPADAGPGRRRAVFEGASRYAVTKWLLSALDRVGQNFRGELPKATAQVSEVPGWCLCGCVCVCVCVCVHVRACVRACLCVRVSFRVVRGSEPMKAERLSTCEGLLPLVRQLCRGEHDKALVVLVGKVLLEALRRFGAQPAL
jgi:hypothetical protein